MRRLVVGALIIVGVTSGCTGGQGESGATLTWFVNVSGGVAVDHRGGVAAIATPAGVLVVDGVADPVRHGSWPVEEVAVDSDGTVWAVGDGLVGRVVDGEWSEIPISLDAGSWDVVGAFAQSDQVTIAVADVGLLSVTGDGVGVVRDLADLGISTLDGVASVDGELVVAEGGRLVEVLGAGSRARSTPTGLFGDVVSLGGWDGGIWLIDAAGTLWFESGVGWQSAEGRFAAAADWADGLLAVTAEGRLVGLAIDGSPLVLSQPLQVGRVTGVAPGDGGPLVVGSAATVRVSPDGVKAIAAGAPWDLRVAAVGVDSATGDLLVGSRGTLTLIDPDTGGAQLIAQGDEYYVRTNGWVVGIESLLKVDGESVHVVGPTPFRLLTAAFAPSPDQLILGGLDYEGIITVDGGGSERRVPFPAPVKIIAAAANGSTVLFGTETTLSVSDSVGAPLRVGDNPGATVAVAHPAGGWVIAGDGGVWRVDGDVISMVGTGGGETVYAVSVDADQTIWIAHRGGLTCIEDRSRTELRPFGSAPVWTVAPDGNGNLLMGSPAGFGILEYDGGCPDEISGTMVRVAA